MSTADKAQELRRLHDDPELLVVVNVWDAITATTVANTPGTKALATASHGIAASRGYPDGEVIPRDEMIAEVGLIARQTALPVTADLEAGYGDPVGTAHGAWKGGLVGVNFEDSPGDVLLPIEQQAANIHAIRDAVPELVINARVDVFLNGDGNVDEAVERANAYLAAGADCAYPIFCPAEAVAELAQRINGPINVLLTPKMPSAAELAALGAARLTWGAGLAGLAYKEAARVVSAELAQ
jgi:2-methylisocitrate lyase-like PEP mutase family enzyme